MQSLNCPFCNILVDQPHKILFETEELFIFEDIVKGRAQRHVLVCPKKHIESIDTLNSSEHIFLLDQMQNQAEAFLQQNYPHGEFRFGYHRPPFISVKHLHLHGLVLPINNCMDRWFKYRWFLASTEEVKRKVQGRKKK